MSKMLNLCGFVVVRKPEFAANELIRPNLRLGNLLYQGVDRLRWEDLEVAHYNRTLPTAMIPIFEELERENNDLSGLKLLKDLSKAQRTLSLASAVSEIIGIWSVELEQIKGSQDHPLNWNFLGFDCFGLGEWSLLLEGVFAHPNLFPGLMGNLNENGLLRSEQACLELRERYLALSEEELVEPLMQSSSVTNVKIFGPRCVS
ncbi:hypothetical protein [Bradyrhizobium sp. WD16]|uniref:hypothetical protein n=1 Tax=Bradyrhizobium sp. WD16 TaxID=1521768 RepID=UPI0020A609A7|nr:hypothetical protein [Bradyrhizobium sp. WD16]UTD28360.1 hypothetical protein DB459_17100 [Bradyrhizobium sp. WD16]